MYQKEKECHECFTKKELRNVMLFALSEIEKSSENILKINQINNVKKIQDEWIINVEFIHNEYNYEIKIMDLKNKMKLTGFEIKKYQKQITNNNEIKEKFDILPIPVYDATQISKLQELSLTKYEIERITKARKV